MQQGELSATSGALTLVVRWVPAPPFPGAAADCMGRNAETRAQPYMWRGSLNTYLPKNGLSSLYCSLVG